MKPGKIIALQTFLILYPSVIFSQVLLQNQLEKYFAQLRTNIPSAQKILVSDSIRNIIEPYAMSDSVFDHQFTTVKSLGQFTSPDSLLKIINWNFVAVDGKNRYYCYFIYRPEKDKQPSFIFLNREYDINSPGENDIYSPSTWYGAIYYDVRPFIFMGERHYMLLGIDYGNPFITRKIIEPLKIVSGDSLVFGVECLTDGKQIKKRVIFEYSATALMSLKFESDTMIVFDHLSPFSPELKGNRQFYGPDFSFDAFFLDKNGIWRLIEDIDIRNRKNN